MADVILHNLIFFALACGALGWAQWRTLPGPRFPGPRPVGPVFKIWLVVIWSVGLVLPLVALVVDGVIGGNSAVTLALAPYFVMFFAQVASEIFVWKRWRSPVWVLVPCLYLPWRLYQVSMAFDIAGAAGPIPVVTLITLWALALLWIINIGVHYTNIPNTLRWDYHPADSAFPSLHDPRVFTAQAQDALDRSRAA
jgi:hypothetical protein